MACKDVVVVSAFHQDIVWRRQPAEQAAIRAAQLDSAFAALERYPDFTFEIDQAYIIREYLAAHPERRAVLQQLIDAGRVDVTGGEEAIPDTNLVSGEGLVRNIFLGRLWFAEEFGIRPVVANIEDAFGMSAQLPQVLAGFGYETFANARMPGLDRHLSRDGVLWEGLDGSRIFYADPHAGISEHTHVCNLPLVYTPRERMRDCVQNALHTDAPLVFCRYCSEEDLVNDEVLRLVRDTPRPRGTRMRFGLSRAVLAEMRRRNPDPPVVRGEFNPSQAGTHATRISLKQAYRQAEWQTIAAEALAARASLAGGGYPLEPLAALWRALSVVQFHDAICGCHADCVYTMLMERCAAITGQANAIARQAAHILQPSAGTEPGMMILNPLPHPRREPLRLSLPAGTTLAAADGAPLPAERRGEDTLVIADIAAMGASYWHSVPADVPAPSRIPGDDAVGQPLHCGVYEVMPHHDRITIRRQDWNRTLVNGPFPEVRFRLEDGTLWDERLLGEVYPERAGTQHLTAVEDGPVSLRLCWQGEILGDPTADPVPPVWQAARRDKPVVYADLQYLRWEKELIFYRDLERIDATVRIDWQGRNTEILIGFPLQLDLRHTRALYEIPFAALERKPYFEVAAYSPEAKAMAGQPAIVGGKGAWPALTLAAYQDQAWGLALANRGTPAHRIMNGSIEVVVLRSPTTKASNFSVPPLALENGPHTWEFTLQPYQGDLRRGTAATLGACFNAPPLVQPVTLTGAKAPASLLTLTAPGISFSAFKHAERRAGYILRTYETFGHTTTGKLLTAFPLAEVHECNLMEEPVKKVNPAKLTWRPYEIKTLLLVPSENSSLVEPSKRRDGAK
jgi:alpha-mannosidase